MVDGHPVGSLPHRRTRIDGAGSSLLSLFGAVQLWRQHSVFALRHFICLKMHERILTLRGTTWVMVLPGNPILRSRQLEIKFGSISNTNLQAMSHYTPLLVA